MTRVIRATVLAASCAVAVASHGEEDEKAYGRHKVGNLWYTARLQLKDVGVDANVFHTLQDPTRDAIVVVGPRIEGVLPTGRVRFAGNGFVETTYYRRVGDQRSTDFGGEGKAELDLRALTLFGGGGGGQFTNRLSIDVDERLKRQERRGHIGATVRFAGRLSATAQASGEIMDFQGGVFRAGGDVKAALDRNTVAAAGQFRVGLRRRTGLIASAEAVEDKFVSQQIDIPRTHRSYRYLAGVEVRESTSGRMPFGRVMVGVRDMPDTVAQGSPFYRGPAATAQLEVPLGRALRLRGAFDRDVVYASSIVSARDLKYRNAYVYLRYEGRATVSLPGRVDVLASGGFEQARYLLPYPYPDASSFALFDRLDHRWTGSLGLSRRFGDTVRIGGQVSWVRRVSSLPLFSYEGTRYGFNAEIVP